MRRVTLWLSEQAGLDCGVCFPRTSSLALVRLVDVVAPASLWSNLRAAHAAVPQSYPVPRWQMQQKQHAFLMPAHPSVLCWRRCPHAVHTPPRLSASHTLTGPVRQHGAVRQMYLSLGCETRGIEKVGVRVGALRRPAAPHRTATIATLARRGPRLAVSWGVGTRHY